MSLFKCQQSVCCFASLSHGTKPGKAKFDIPKVANRVFQPFFVQGHPLAAFAQIARD